MTTRTSSHLACVLLAAASLAAGCSKKKEQSGDTPPAATSSGQAAKAEPSGELVVFAAASLTDAFNAIARDFEKAHPGVDVKLNFAGSQSLRTQIENGAQPQVFASANAKHMDALVEQKLVGEPVTFVHNKLVIVVPAGNPAKIGSLKDLPGAPHIVLAGENVPAGAYAAKMLANASATKEYGADFADQVKKHVVSREPHVRETLQKVVLGEADAAVVYATDAVSAGDKVKTIDIPPELNVLASYPIATVSGAPHQELGKMFVAFVLSDAGKTRLKEQGFQPAGAVAAAPAAAGGGH